MVDEWLDKADTAATEASDALDERNRRDIVIALDEEASFANGSRLDRPSGEDTVPAGAKNGTFGGTLNLSKPIELIHFGTVYRDRSDRFAHDEVDDMVVLEPGALAGRAAQYRAALLREIILLRSTAGGLVDAIADVYGAPSGSGPGFVPNVGGIGGLGQLLGFAGDLFGGPAASAQAMATSDFQGVVAELDAVWNEVNVADIRYEALHAAGIRLHEIRTGLRKYCKTHRDNLVHSLTAPGGGGPGILQGLPFLGDFVPPVLGEYFAFAAAAPNLIFDVYMQVLLDLSLVMGPSVDAAARDKTIDAITSGFSPIFPVWYPPPPPDAAPASGPATPTGIGAIDDVINDVTQKVDAAEKKVDEVVSFLSRPYQRSPGGPFVDRAFGGTAIGLAADEAAGVVAIQALKTAVGYDPPALVVTIFEKLAGIIGGFVRSVYSQLAVVGATPVPKAEVVEAGRRHLIDAVIECIFTSLPALEVIRNDFMPPVSVQGWTIPINGRALIDRAKELLSEQLAGPLQPIMDFAMGDLTDTLNRALANAYAATMEAHLGIVPVCFAKLLRNIFFPIWDLLMNSVLAPIGAAVSPATSTMNGVLDQATGMLQTVRDGIARAQKVSNILGDGFQADLAGNDVQRIYDAITGASPGGGGSGPGPAGPGARKRKGKASPIPKSEYAKVSPDHKWVEPEEKAARGAGGDA